MGLDSVLTDGQKLDATLHIMTTVIYRDGVLNNTECEPLLAEEVRFADTIGRRFIISPERLGSVYGQPVPVLKRGDRKYEKSCHEQRKNIEDELAQRLTGPRPGAALYLEGSDTGIPEAPDYDAREITPSGDLEAQIIHAIAVAVYQRFVEERRADLLKEAQKKAEDAEGERAKYLRRYPNAKEGDELLAEYTAMRETKKCHDKRSRGQKIAEVVSPQPAVPGAAAASKPAPLTAAEKERGDEFTRAMLKQMCMETPKVQAYAFRKMGSLGKVAGRAYVDHVLDAPAADKRSHDDVEEPIDLDQPTTSSQKRRRLKHTPSGRLDASSDDDDAPRVTASQQPLADADEGPPPLEDE